jgi:hypothetical protein
MAGPQAVLSDESAIGVRKFRHQYRPPRLACALTCARARASARPVSRCYWPLPSSSQSVRPQRARAVWRMSRGIGRPAHRRQRDRGRAGRQGVRAAAGYEAAAGVRGAVLRKCRRHRRGHGVRKSRGGRRPRCGDDTAAAAYLAQLIVRVGRGAMLRRRPGKVLYISPEMLLSISTTETSQT